MAETAASKMGALRLRLVAAKDGKHDFASRDAADKHLPPVVLDLDHQAFFRKESFGEGCDIL